MHTVKYDYITNSANKNLRFTRLIAAMLQKWRQGRWMPHVYFQQISESAGVSEKLKTQPIDEEYLQHNCLGSVGNKPSHTHHNSPLSPNG